MPIAMRIGLFFVSWLSLPLAAAPSINVRLSNLSATTNEPELVVDAKLTPAQVQARFALITSTLDAAFRLRADIRAQMRAEAGQYDPPGITDFEQLFLAPSLGIKLAKRLLTTHAALTAGDLNVAASELNATQGLLREELRKLILFKLPSEAAPSDVSPTNTATEAVVEQSIDYLTLRLRLDKKMEQIALVAQNNGVAPPPTAALQPMQQMLQSAVDARKFDLAAGTYGEALLVAYDGLINEMISNIDPKPRADANPFTRTKTCRDREPATPPTLPADSKVRARIDPARASNIGEYYDPAARRAGEEGVVVLLVTVTPSGCPRKVQVGTSSGYGRLDEGAVRWALASGFEPQRENGTPIESITVMRVRFKMSQ